MNAETFLDYLKKLRAKQRSTPLALFMDQLPVHKSKELKGWWVQLNITPVLNVGYCPEFNPIEAVFSKVKRVFCS